MIGHGHGDSVDHEHHRVWVLVRVSPRVGGYDRRLFQAIQRVILKEVRVRAEISSVDSAILSLISSQAASSVKSARTTGTLQVCLATQPSA
jgi:hypothetical protein